MHTAATPLRAAAPTALHTTPAPPPAARARPQVFTVGKTLSRDGLGTDWYEGAAVQSDRVLDDFLKALTPAVATPNLPYKWLHRLDGAEAINYVNPRTCASVRTCGMRRPVSTCPNAFWSCADGTLQYGYRNYHCRPADCTKVSCWCCGGGVPSTCSRTCAVADKGKCPR